MTPFVEVPTPSPLSTRTRSSTSKYAVERPPSYRLPLFIDRPLRPNVFNIYKFRGESWGMVRRELILARERGIVKLKLINNINRQKG